MKRLAPTFCLVLGLALVSCSDDGDDVPGASTGDGGAKDGSADVASTDGGGSGDGATADTGPAGDGGAADGGAADGGDASAPVCKGLSTGVTREQLGQKVTMGKCNVPSDLDAICNNDLVDITSKCGGFTFLMLKGKVDAGASFMVDEAMLRAGTVTCVKNLLAQANAPVGDECLSCYGAAVTCTLSHCGNVCLPDPTNPECRPCQISSGCGAGLYACSGLPAPASVIDGGAPAGDASDTSAPASDAPVSTVDGATD